MGAEAGFLSGGGHAAIGSGPEPRPVFLPNVPGRPGDARGTREQRLAFWINTYNALVAHALVALDIRQSVWEVPGFFDRIRCRLGDLTFSADEIEHGLLRGNRPGPLSTAVPFQADDPRRPYAIAPLEPRLHFAISCGARSCPKVRPYQAERLHEQLDAATHAFVNREVILEGETVTASRIFDWFRADFEEAPGGLAAFLVRYLDDGPTRQAILARGIREITWRPYDWRVAHPEGEPWIVRA